VLFGQPRGSFINSILNYRRTMLKIFRFSLFALPSSHHYLPSAHPPQPPLQNRNLVYRTGWTVESARAVCGQQHRELVHAINTGENNSMAALLKCLFSLAVFE